MASCKSCDATITWAKTERGKSMPLIPHPDGDWVVVRPGLGIPPLAVRYASPPADGALQRKSAAEFAAGRLYRSHFSGCPGAAAHRKAK
jgi:hypothetical protein